MPLTVVRPATLEQLNDQLTSGGTIDGCKMHLYDVNFAWSPDTTLGSIHEAGFTGYAASSLIIWGTAFLNSGGLPEVVGDVKTFTCTGIASTGIVYGYYLTSTAAGLIGGEPFATPFTMSSTGAAIPIVTRFPLSSLPV
jgi:hypothetical protein